MQKETGKRKKNYVKYKLKTETLKEKRKKKESKQNYKGKL